MVALSCSSSPDWTLKTLRWAFLTSSSSVLILSFSDLRSPFYSSTSLTSSCNSSIFRLSSFIFLSKSVFSPSQSSFSILNLLCKLSSLPLRSSNSNYLVLANSKNYLSSSIFLLPTSTAPFWLRISFFSIASFILETSPWASRRAFLVSWSSLSRFWPL